MNPMDIKRGIDIAVSAIIAHIRKHSRKVSTNEEIAQIGTISANGDREIGQMLARPCTAMRASLLSGKQVLAKPNLRWSRACNLIAAISVLIL
jgi:chaperonin GroEL (HSP60 family)